MNTVECSSAYRIRYTVDLHAFDQQFRLPRGC